MENKLTVTINQTELPVKEYQGKRVVTLKEIDAVHNRPEGTARKRFNDNKKRFIMGTDYFQVCASEIRTNNIMELSPKAHEDVTLITESGYLMLVKSFTDDLAWTVQRQLVNTYFRSTPEQRRDAAKLTASQLPKLPPLSSVNSAVKFALQTMEEAGVDPAFKLLALRNFYAPYGLDIPINSLPKAVKTYDLTAIAESLGVMSARSGKPHKNAVGAIVQLVGVTDKEVIKVPYTNNGHSGFTDQYTESVLERVRRWLETHGWPSIIEGMDGTSYKVSYRGHIHAG